MPYYEFAQKWAWSTSATTGGGTVAEVRGQVARFTFSYETGAGCTCTAQMQAAANSSGPWFGLSASTAISTSACLIQQFAGPLAFLRPYVSAKTTGGLTIEATGN